MKTALLSQIANRGPKVKVEEDKKSLYQTGDRLWIPDEDHAWLCGTIQSIAGTLIEFTTQYGPRKVPSKPPNNEISKLEPCGNHLDDNVENLVDLDELSEGAILHHVRTRFLKKVIYTHVGSILVAVNPFEKLDIYSAAEMKRAHTSCSSDSPTLYPHVFISAAMAFQQLRTNGKNQSVLISGESGAGKTETTKKVLAFLANVAPALGRGKSEVGMETKILQSNPLLEALGNAKTLRNDNSSRFGKWMKVGFDKGFCIQGCEIVNYLLEKSRVVNQSSKERNYHIFYQLIQGADEQLKKALYLDLPESYHYLNQSGCMSIDEVDDAAEFADVLTAMQTLQFSDETIHSMLSVIAGILTLGNINFIEGSLSDSSKVAPQSEQHLAHCAELLGLSPDIFRYCLVEKISQMARGSIVKKPLSISQALDNRDTLSKALYSNLFDWTIQRVNSTLKTSDPPFSVGILDIFGFEVFDVNSFEQLCINYANEKLQQHFNEVIFNLEREMYLEEGIPLSEVAFEDNSACVMLIEGKTGLISLLDDECSLGPKGTDIAYINKVVKEVGEGRPTRNEFFKKNKVRPESFSVAHFAGDVEYCVTGFLEKNRDSLSNTSKEVVMQSTLTLITEMFSSEQDDPAAKGKGGRGGSAQPSGKATLGSQFRSQLVGLVKNLKLTEPHFIRCVKPNQQKVKGVFTGPLALRQLRYAGLFEAIRIRKSGFSYRASFSSFVNLYKILVDGLSLKAEASRKRLGLGNSSEIAKEKKQDKAAIEREFCIEILNAVTAIPDALSRDDWHVGTTKVFLRSNSHRLSLDRLKVGRLSTYILRLQTTGRRFLEKLRGREIRKQYLLEKANREYERTKQVRCAIIIQKYARRFLVQKMMEAMQHLLQLRKVLQNRETAKVAELLSIIEGSSFFAQRPNSKVAMMFNKEVKVAKVMVKLLKLQEKLVTDVQICLETKNIAELNRLLLKSGKLDMDSHPVVVSGREELQRQHKKRTVVKRMMLFLSHEDDYCETIQETIREAKKLDVDMAFIDRVQRVFDNAGPRLKARNRLRSAIELLDRFAIERGCLEVLSIQRKYNQGNFADSELKAAKFVLRLLHFDSQMQPKSDDQQQDSAAANYKAKASVEEDQSESGTVHKELFPPAEREEISLWGAEIARCSTGGKLTRELIEICNEIVSESGKLSLEISLNSNEYTKRSSMETVNMLKMKLQETCGSVQQVYDVIRYFKWYKTACTWRYPEVSSNGSTEEEEDMFSSSDHNHEVRSIASQSKEGSDQSHRSSYYVPEGSFYGFRPVEARSNAFVIRSLHLNFGADPSNPTSSSSSSSLLLAALGCVDTTSSMAQTLHHIDANVSVDKQIVLPNGAQFVKTKTNSIADRATRENISHQKVVRKAPLPVTPTKSIAHMEESNIEKQLHLSRKLREDMLKKVDKSREKAHKAQKFGWK